jgi:predicted HicB family RNase H-like nuclease
MIICEVRVIVIIRLIMDGATMKKNKTSTYNGYTDSRKAANKKYQENTIDLITLRVPKGAKENIRKAAAADGKSLNAYIVSAINEKMIGKR